MLAVLFKAESTEIFTSATNLSNILNNLLQIAKQSECQQKVILVSDSPMSQQVLHLSENPSTDKRDQNPLDLFMHKPD